MPRQPRIEVAGATYHVTSRGNRRQPIYLDVLDRRRYLLLLADVCARHKWRCFGYCLMTNHVHLLIETPQTDLGRGMHRLNTLFAQWFNWPGISMAISSRTALGARSWRASGTCSRRLAMSC